MRTVRHPSRGGAVAVPGAPAVASAAALDPSSLVVTYRMPTINNAPATMAAISGSLVRLPDVPVPEVWIIGSAPLLGAFRGGENALILWVSVIPTAGRSSNAVRIGQGAAVLRISPD